MVADASVAVKWLLTSELEAYTERATELLLAAKDGRIELVQPPHWMAEVVAVITRLRPDMAHRAVDLLDAMEVAVAADSAVYRRGCLLATSLRQHLFDTLYHAVALEHDALLVTADERYFDKAARLGGIAHLRSWLAPAPVAPPEA